MDQPSGKNTPLTPAGSPLQRHVTTESNKANARKFFEHAKKSAETRNYDYAIKLYCDGLALWPDAIEEALRPLRVVATARRLEGGKGPGFLAARKLPTNTKDVYQNLNNAIHLFGLDPSEVGYIETVILMANKAGLDRVVHFMAPVLVDAFNNAKKLPNSHYAQAAAAMDAAGELAQRENDAKIAMDIFQAAISSAQIWAEHYPAESEAQRARSSASGKLAIIKGKFDKADGFTDSLKDAESQADIRDRDRSVQTGERLNTMIEKARQEWEQNRGVPAKLINLIDLLLRMDQEAGEAQATELLEAEYQATQNYVFKSKADDVRMRQFNRKRRVLEAKVHANPGDAALQKELADVQAHQNNMEIAIYRDRLRQYPTELKIKYLLATRLFVGSHFDEAIPLFQQSQFDGRFRAESRLFMGRCFLEKGFSDQAIATLQKAVEELESSEGAVPLELNYWLGRSLEKAGQAAEARKVYGHLIQMDYNYRDARGRLEKLVAGQG